MTRINASKLLSVIIAYTEGRTIQYNKKGEWYDSDELHIDKQTDPKKWRVKPTIDNVVSCGISTRGSLMKCQFDRKGICIAKLGKGMVCINQVKRLTPEEEDRNKKLIVDYGL